MKDSKGPEPATKPRAHSRERLGALFDGTIVLQEGELLHQTRPDVQQKRYAGGLQAGVRGACAVEVQGVLQTVLNQRSCSAKPANPLLKCQTLLYNNSQDPPLRSTWQRKGVSKRHPQEGSLSAASPCHASDQLGPRGLCVPFHILAVCERIALQHALSIHAILL